MKRVSTLSMLCTRLALWLGVAGALIGPTLQAQPAGPQGSWSIKAPLPIKLVEVAVAAANGKIYVLGGSAADRVFQPLNQEYDPATDRWRERAPLPRALNHAGATGLNGKIYVVGAFTAAGHSAPMDAVFEYDPATDTWRALAPLKSPRGSVGVTVLGGKIHAIGGRGPDKVTVGTHEVYDPASGTWSELAPLPTARDHLAVVAAGDRIHAIGGRLDSFDQNVDLHDIYHPATNTWETGAPMPTARSAVAGALYQHMLVVAGGECRDERTYSETEAYDLTAGRWAKLTPLPAGRHGFGVVTVGPALYFAAGSLDCGGGGRLSDELLVLTLP
jgi:Kelch motif/Galactose oxidase, central domain